MAERMAKEAHESDCRRAAFEAVVTTAAVDLNLTIPEVVVSLSQLSSRYARHIIQRDIVASGRDAGNEHER